MGTVTLRSRVGPIEFTRRTRVSHESGNEFLTPVTYRFSLDNGFKTAVPSQVWEELKDEYLDRKAGLRYQDALIPF